MKLADKTAIVTGAASGIGRAIARAFAAEGARVVIADLRDTPVEGGKPTTDLIEADGGQVQFIRTDAANWGDIDSLVTETANLHGRIDVMVNNAAVYTGTRLTETTEEEWDRVMAVNLRGVFLCCKRAVEQMLEQDIVKEVRGRIVNISSQHGMVSCPGDFPYGVSKSGVVYMTRQIAADYASDHIVCNAIAPGKILTGRKDPESISDSVLDYARSRTPYHRLGKPDDVANAAVFLASDECTYMTGENVMVDGGWMAA